MSSSMAHGRSIYDAEAVLLATLVKHIWSERKQHVHIES
jgi:hypothetical protein